MINNNHKQPDNIIFIVADSLRYNTVFKSGSAGMPYIENNSTSFSEARSAGCWTLPATASLFTGLMPHEHGATSQSRNMTTNKPTLAENLRSIGYDTQQVTANIATTEIFGLDRGFNEVHKVWRYINPKFKTFTRFLILFSKPRIRKILLSKDKVVKKLTEDLEGGNCWLQNTYPDIFDKSREIISNNEANGKKSFLFLNLMESHFPYHAFPKMKLYSDNIIDKLTEMSALYHTINQSFLKHNKSYIKEKGKRIIRERQRKSWEIIREPLDEFVRELHQDKNNLVIFISDHGENFGEQDWFYHFSNVTDAGNKVPMFWLDNNSNQKKNLAHPVSTRFLYDEILHSVNANGGPRLMEESNETLPILQSYWYNNMGRTLKKYMFNQFAFIDNNMRYVYRNGDWLYAPPATLETEPPFKKFPDGTNPIQEFIEDAARKKIVKDSFEKFKVFSKEQLKVD